MELGEKLRQARLEARLSQRQLCGEEITRNMLSLIEHGTAKPSMKTLQYLAARLGKPVGYFLDDMAVMSPNQSVMESARRLYDDGEFGEALLVLEGYQSPDPVHDREQSLLRNLSLLNLGEQALDQGREIYARELLNQADCQAAYVSPELTRRKLLLLGRIPGETVSHLLPSLDEELLLRAREALTRGNPVRAAALLDAAEDRESPQWYFYRGQVFFSRKEYPQAARCFRGAESVFPRECAEKLEICYRELGDFKQAYEYACKQRT